MADVDDPEDLMRLLGHVKYVLEEIDRGASFLEDRGFGWSIDVERSAGIDDIRAALDTKPELAALLPQLGSMLRDRERVIGLETIPHDEVKAAIRLIKRDIQSKHKA